jgi:hypothetical protein
MDKGDRREEDSAQQGRIRLYDGGGHGRVQTGPHVMIVGTAAREMASIYTRTLDPDPSQAYVMFPGTPYEHLMLSVHSQQDVPK